MGLLLASTLTAHDLGYLSLGGMVALTYCSSRSIFS